MASANSTTPGRPTAASRDCDEERSNATRRGPWPTTTRIRGAPSRLTIAPRPDQVSPTCRAPGGTPKFQFVEPICVAGVGPVHMPPQQLGAEEPVQGDARAFLGVTEMMCSRHAGGAGLDPPRLTSYLPSVPTVAGRR